MNSVGRVIALWRYPVKSFLGEPLNEARFGGTGVDGDRAYAIRDVASGHVLSAKKFSQLLTARAHGHNGTVALALPDGDDLRVDDPNVDGKLSQWLGREVVLDRAPGGSRRPEIEGDTRVFLGRPGGFHDSSAVHIVTTSTLATLASFHPQGVWDARRFRPNIVLETPLDGFVEETWLGQMFHVGDVDIELTKACSRCVLTTHAMEDLPVDRDILRTVNAKNDEHVGVYGIVRTPGTARIGDEATLG